MKDFIALIDAKDERSLLDEFEAVVPSTFREPGFVAKYLALPNVVTASITIDGEKSYIVAYHVTADNGLWIDVCTAAKQSSPKNTHKMFSILTDLAKKKGCKYIGYMTARQGLIEVGKQNDFTATAIMMVKGI